MRYIAKQAGKESAASQDLLGKSDVEISTHKKRGKNGRERAPYSPEGKLMKTLPGGGLGKKQPLWF